MALWRLIAKPGGEWSDAAVCLRTAVAVSRSPLCSMSSHRQEGREEKVKECQGQGVEGAEKRGVSRTERQRERHPRA
eukprot:3366219-Prorocentrum_lima.AAC.1